MLAFLARVIAAVIRRRNAGAAILALILTLAVPSQAFASAGCDDVNNGLINGTGTAIANGSAAPIGTTTNAFTAGDVLHISYTGTSGAIPRLFVRYATTPVTNVSVVWTYLSSDLTTPARTDYTITNAATVTRVFTQNSQVGPASQSNVSGSSASFTVTCTPAGDPTPTLTFATPTAATVDLNGAVLTNAATSSISSGGAISYSSGTTGVATVNSSGVITAVSTGTSVITATQAASAGVNAQGTQTYTLTVSPTLVATQSVASTTLTSGTAATAFTPVTGSGGTGTLTYALYDSTNSAAATLPSGLSFSTSTGQISGTPSVAAAATTYTVRVTDQATAQTTATNTFSLTVNAPNPPTITAAFSPTSISTSGAATLTLTVTNPNSGTSLTGVAIAASALPTNLSGSGAITNCTGGTATFSGGSLSLSGATLAGSASCTVTLAVSSTTAGNYSYTTGAVSASGPIALTGSTATTATQLTVTAVAPTVTSVSPTSGAGGATVTITGTNFTGATAVSFGGTAAASFTVNSATQITATAPTGTGTVDVRVTTAAGTSAINAGDQFLFLVSPVITTNPTNYTASTGTGATFTAAATGSPTPTVQWQVSTDGGLNFTNVSGATTTTLALFSVTSAQNGNRYRAVFTNSVASATTTAATLTVYPTLVATQAVASTVATFNRPVTPFIPVTASGGSGTYSYALYNAANTAPAQLPSPMTFNTSTGAVSGTPGGTSPATTYTVRVTDTSPTPATATNTFSFSVVAPPTATQAVPSVVLTLNTAVTSVVPVTGAGGAAPLTYAISPTLPAGLTFNTSTGAITGTPTVAFAGGIFTVTVTDVNGGSASNTFALRVALGPTATQAIASRTLTQNVLATPFTPVTGGGGATPLTYSISPTLPTGLSLSTTTGAITGTPTVASAATTYTVTVTDANNATATNNFVLTVNAVLPTISSISPTSGPTVGGTSVTINGTNFTGATAVSFGATAAMFTVNSATQITASAPAGTGTVDIRVTTAGGTSATSAADQFTYRSTVSTLSNLALSSGTVSPTFASGTTSYTASVANAVSAITVTPTVTDATATVKVNGTTVASGTASGSIALAVGQNTITTVVTAQDGTTTTTYTVVVTRAASSNANLSNLALSSGTLSPSFSANTTSYTASVANAVSAITVTPVTSSGFATVTVNGTTVASGSASGSIALAVGQNTITTVVTAQDGTTIKTYTVVVTRAPSAVATLSNLALSSGTLSPSFASGTTSYTASVANSVTAITVTPTVSDATATVTVNGTTVASGSASGSIALAVGQNTITTVVTAQDGTTNSTYTVVVTRAGSSVATLSNLALSSGTLSPTFASGTTSYTASVANSVTAITVTPTVTDATATVTVNGTTVASGSASGSISLNVGTNTISTVVTAQDGTTNSTYTVVVTRAAAALTTSVNYSVSSIAAGAQGTLTITFTNPNSSSTPAFNTALHSDTSVFTRSPGLGGTCNLNAAQATVPSASQVNLNNLVIAPGSCTVTFPYNGTTPGVASWSLDSFTPTGFATTAAVTSSNVTVYPTVTAITPTTGSSAGGTTVRLTGTGFSTTLANNTVRFGSASATVTAATATNMTVTSPSGSGTVDVTVTVNSQTSPTSAADRFIYRSTVSTLSNLALSSGTLSPSFATGTTSYTASVANSVTAITVTPTVTDATATVTVNGTAVTSGSPSGSINLNVGQNTITTVVTAQDGTTISTYTVVVTRAPSAVATLSNLALSSGTLAPTFASGTTSYTASVANSVTAITVTPTVADATATVTVNGTAVASGSASGSITLPVGNTTITVVVTAQDGTTNSTYTVVVTRAIDPPVAGAVTAAVPYGSTGTAINASLSGGATASIAIATQPSHGSVTINGTTMTYTPASGYFGTDSFTYTATNATATSAPATVSITVATPPPPSAQTGTASVTSSTVQGGGSVGVNLSALVTGVYTDISISSQPTNGTVTLTNTLNSAGSGQREQVLSGIIATYRPRVGFYGRDSFSFVANGPGGPSQPATVTITVVGIAPTAQAKTAATGDNQAVDVDLTAGATEGPFTSAAIVSQPSSAQATVQLVESGPAGNHLYHLVVTPAGHFGGTLVLTYTVSNQFGASRPATVTITVTARPDPTLNPDIQAISDAQAEATRDLARAQIENFMRRAEALHHGGGSARNVQGIRLVSANGGTIELANNRRFPSTDPRALADLNNNGISWSGPYSDGARIGRGDRGGINTLNIGYGDDGYGDDGLGGRGTASAGSGGRGLGGRGLGGGGLGGGATGTANTEGKGGSLGASGNGGDNGERRVGSLVVWSGGSVSIGTRDRETGRDKITISTAGLSSGVDVKLAENATIGIGGGYGAETNKIGGDAGRVRSQATVVAAYGSVAPLPDTFIDVTVGYGSLDFATRRLVQENGLTATGSRSGTMWFGAAAFGIDRASGPVHWSAYGRTEWLSGTLNSYVETGADRYNLRFLARSLTSITSVAGGKISYTGTWRGITATPRLRAEWRHEFDNGSRQALDYADLTGTPAYALNPIGWTREQYQVGVGSRFGFGSGWAFDIEMDFNGADKYRQGTLRAALSKKF